MNWLENLRKEEYNLAENISSNVFYNYFTLKEIDESIDHTIQELGPLLSKCPSKKEVKKGMIQEFKIELYAYIESIDCYLADHILSYDNWEHQKIVPFPEYTSEKIRKAKEFEFCDGTEITKLCLDELIKRESNLPLAGKIKKSKHQVVIKPNYSMLKKWQDLIDLENSIKND